MKTIRLDNKLEASLKQYARQRDVSESQVIREAISEYLEKKDIKASSYTIGKPYFGKYGSGSGSDKEKGNRSITYKSRFKSKVREKTSR